MSNVINTFQHGNKKVLVSRSDDTSTAYDFLVEHNDGDVMLDVCVKDQYMRLRQTSYNDMLALSGWKEYDTLYRTDYHVIPLYLYRHSGDVFSTSKTSAFDSGRVGAVLVKRGPELNDTEAKKEAEKIIKMLNAVVQGDIYDVRIVDADGEEQDLCSDFFSKEDALQWAKELCEA